MANEKNNTPEEDWVASTGDFWGDLAKLQKRAPSFGNKKHPGAAFYNITFQYGRRLDSGAIEVSALIPSECSDILEAIIKKEREPNFRLISSEPNIAERARLGEFEPLISHFEGGGKLTDKERRILAKIARGMLPRIGRPPESKTETRNRDIARFAITLKWFGGKRVADVTAKKFDIDRSYVTKLMKKYQGEARGPYLLGCLLTAIGADQATARKAALAGAGISDDDLREATGRKKLRK